jgi:hypothetical protein
MAKAKRKASTRSPPPGSLSLTAVFKQLDSPWVTNRKTLRTLRELLASGDYETFPPLPAGWGLELDAAYEPWIITRNGKLPGGKVFVRKRYVDPFKPYVSPRAQAAIDAMYRDEKPAVPKPVEVAPTPQPPGKLVKRYAWLRWAFKEHPYREDVYESKTAYARFLLGLMPKTYTPYQVTAIVRYMHPESKSRNA